MSTPRIEKLKQVIKEKRAKVTYRDTLRPAMEITDEQEAKEYLDCYVTYLVTQFGITVKRAEEDARSNIGYYAGYYNSETRQRVKRLFNASHPIFGDKTPTPEEAFAAGKKFAEDRYPQDPFEFSETPEGEEAKYKWAKRYDELNGAPEGDWDR